MLDIAWGEYLFIAILALILLGPNELPVVLRTIGRWVTKIRHISATFQEQLSQLEENAVPQSDSHSDLLDLAEEEEPLKTYPLPSQPTDTFSVKLPKAYPLPWV
jgi:sec-independent protein translocase protein TatB